MLELQSKMTSGLSHELEGRCIQKVYVLNDTKPESSDESGFSLQVFETVDGTFFYVPPVETTAEVYVDDSLSDVYETVEHLKEEGYIAKQDA